MHTSHKTGSRLAMVLVALGGTALFSACTVDSTDMPEREELAQDEEENIGTAEQAIYSGWTPYTSEEYPPIICDSASLMSTFQCSGSYCDNIRAYCQPTSGSLGSSSWTSYFSEEGTNSRTCGANAWVTGMSCTGGYCDNVSLQCSTINNITPTSCYWTGWVSEEGGGTLSFGSGYYMRGAQCNGSSCDNMRFYVCQATPAPPAGSCSAATCGGSAGTCYCDAACVSYGDCCSNACSACGAC